MLTLWNSLHKQLEEFIPSHPPKVGLYNCGPTVYKPITLGNWRAYLTVDVLRRVLHFLGYDVTHVMNITDVGHLVGDGDDGEDKMEREATQRGMSAWELARFHEGNFVKDMKRVHMLPPQVQPRATEHIPEQIALVKQLEEKGFAYRISDGIYFDTSQFPSYGALSGQRLEDKEAGARVTVNVEKRHPSDFALWKFSPASATGIVRQMEWESPWGVGFPGWHLECSAMSTKYLGQPFDIHCGGIDLIPVHHENEIAQTMAATSSDLANYWVHNEFLLIDGGRMGKSLGNAYTLDDVIAKGFDPLAYRYFCLGAHYRSKLNFTWEGMAAASHALKKLRHFARSFPSVSAIVDERSLQSFQQALEADLNTPQALAVLWEMIKSSLAPEVKGATLKQMDQVLGFGFEEIMGKTVEIPDDIRQLAEQRKSARAEKDWPRSDVLREVIQKQGWLIEDHGEDEYLLTPAEDQSVHDRSDS